MFECCTNEIWPAEQFLGSDQLTKISAEWFSEKVESRSGLDGNVICNRHSRYFWVLLCNNHSDWDGCF